MCNDIGSRVLARVATVAVLGASVLGCSTAPKQHLSVKQEHNEPMEITVAAAEAPADLPAKLMIYGGKKHDVYLGCLNCEAEEPESVFNEFGSYGSPYSPYSLWNAETQYGAAGSPTSPLNPRATNPPVVKDAHGTFYGYLTINDHMPQVYHSDEAGRLLKRIQGK